MDLGLGGRTAIIAGAGHGIGRAIAEALLSEGAKIAACCRSRDLTGTLLEGRGRLIFGAPVDAADPTAFGKWYGEAVAQLGGLDHLIWTVSAQSRDLRASFEGEVLAFEAALGLAQPHLRASDSGSVVVIGSQAALLAFPGYRAYAAAKAALVSYCGSAARALAREGIRLNVVSPGEIEFPGGQWERMRSERPELYRTALARTARGRFGTPQEVAQLVVFVASPAASLLSGAHILADHAGREFVQF
jgi:3-oxoacyl-[acyl-carrier protein] reductase